MTILPFLSLDRERPKHSIFFIPSDFYHSHSGKMGSRYHIGKRSIFVCCRDCRSASVLCLWGGSFFFAYPFLVIGGGEFLILIHNYFWFDTSVIPYADARSNAFRAVHLSVLLAFPYLSDYQAPQRLLLRTPPPRMKLAREDL